MRIIIIAMFVLARCGCEIIDTGNRGVKTTYGEIQGEALNEGLHFYNPFTSQIKEISVREEKVEGQTSCFTRDTQKVNIDYAVTFYPDPLKIHLIWKQYGDEWEKKVIVPVILSSLKDKVGQIIADDLVSKREEARNRIFEELAGQMVHRNVFITRIDLTNLDFDDAYEHAVEAKVVAIQKAAEAKNKTVEIQEQSKQKIISAEAEARSMTIRSQALQQNKGLVEYEAVQKWNGVLPQYMMGGSVPFINLDKK